MSLKQRVSQTLTSAMKAKELETVKVLRSVQAAIKQIEIDRQIELDDNGVLDILQKQVKQRQESLEVFQSNDRNDLADKERFEIEVISQFLPEALSQEELLAIVQGAIADLGASGMQDMGKVMSAVKAQTVGRADPSAISVLVKKSLSQNGQ